jgi:hypothetical protein
MGCNGKTRKLSAILAELFRRHFSGLKIALLRSGNRMTLLECCCPRFPFGKYEQCTLEYMFAPRVAVSARRSTRARHSGRSRVERSWNSVSWTLMRTSFRVLSKSPVHR